MSGRNPDLFRSVKPVGSAGRAYGSRVESRQASEGQDAFGVGKSPARVRGWTVAEVARAVRYELEDSFSRIWVTGEVANFSRHRSGHCYFTLKDRTAQLRCVIFRREAAKLVALPQEGMRLRVFGDITLYEARGSCQLVASKVETESGEGVWKLAFDRLLARLESEGLTEDARKRALPPFPRQVGVVTSLSGAALRDVISVIQRRSPWIRLLVRGARVQGEGAAQEVAYAVELLGEIGVEVILVVRGGGSIEDLWAFNEEDVARAVVASPVPVVSGIGHETDVTICDLVADHRAATPSAAAATVAPELSTLLRRLARLSHRLGKGLAAQSESRRWRLNRAQDELFRGVRGVIATGGQELKHSQAQLTEAIGRRIERLRERLARASAEMHVLSPLATLARGYAVPLDEQGRLLRAGADFVADRVFDLRVVDARVPCQVTAPPVKLGGQESQPGARIEEPQR